MAVLKISNTRIAGISACVPPRIFYNDQYDHISPEDRKVLIKTIGVKEKRHVDKGVISSDLCFRAAQVLLDELQWNTDEVDLLVFVSQTRDYMMPATACILQDRLGLTKQCMAFDLDLGCSGYVYGLSVVYSLLSAGGINKALLLAGEVPTPNSSYEDKSVYPLFGDAGTATAVEIQHGRTESIFNLQTDGSGYDAIMIHDGGSRNYIDPAKTFEIKEISEGIKRHRAHIALDGMKVFNFSLTEVRPNIKKVLAEAGKEIDEVDYFVFHQANRLMNETIRKQLKITPEKYPYSIDLYGNTSSASIPLTMVHSLDADVLRQKLSFVLSGFGVGLSWGSCYIETEGIVCPPVIEYK
jgi:3-oxoacyl-[acyl-carrier-protein] synthase-3